MKKLLLFLLLLPALAFGQMQRIVHIQEPFKGVKLNVITYQTPVYSDDWVIWFPGSGEATGPADGSKLANVEKAGYALHAKNGKVFPWNVIAIQCIKGYEEVKDVIVDYLVQVYGARDIVITGHSLGGRETINYLTNYKDRPCKGYVRAFVPVAGQISGSSPVWCTTVDAPVLAVHNVDDTAIRIINSQKLINGLKSCSTRVSEAVLVTRPTGGHSSSWAYTPDPAHPVYQFIAAALRDKAPPPIQCTAELDTLNNTAIFTLPGKQIKASIIRE